MPDLPFAWQVPQLEFGQQFPDAANIERANAPAPIAAAAVIPS